MNSIENLATFLGWCTAINFGTLVLLFLLISLFHEWAGKINAKLFGIAEEEAKVTFFRVFLQYRLAFVMLNVAPYVALKIMS
mgnify:CR=1 FL=1